jgi:hypothetical protein
VLRMRPAECGGLPMACIVGAAYTSAFGCGHSLAGLTRRL